MAYSQNVIVIAGRKQFQISANSRSLPLDAGTYDVWAATDAYIDVAPSDAATPTNTTGYLIPGGAGIISVRIAKDGLTIGASAAISAHRVE